MENEINDSEVFEMPEELPAIFLNRNNPTTACAGKKVHLQIDRKIDRVEWFVEGPCDGTCQEAWTSPTTEFYNITFGVLAAVADFLETGEKGFGSSFEIVLTDPDPPAEVYLDPAAVAWLMHEDEKNKPN